MNQPENSDLITPSNSEELELVERASVVHKKSSGFSSRLSRTWNILKYYRKSQLAIRALRILKGNRKQPSGALLNEGAANLVTRSAEPFLQLAQIRIQNHYRISDDVREDLSNNRVRVLNKTFPLDWRTGGEGSLLWQFQLHYHEYLLPLLKESGNEKDSDRTLVQNVISSWLDSNPIQDSGSHVAAWHPYCISRRLPVWFCILSTDALTNDIKEKATRSAYLQASHLAANLEWDLRGNHLLENLRALALAGSYFCTGDRWLNTVQDTLPKQLKEQVLSWGEHFERCPMYHCQILGNLLETMIVCRDVNKQLYETIRPTAENMLSFLRQIIHPDNEIPLMGDSCFGEAPSVICIEQLADLAGIELPTASSPDSNTNTKTIGPYWIHRDDENYLNFDRGSVGATTLPAHAHCDLLSIEASVNKKRLIVDSGLYNYEDDPMRWYCRSTLAHNVVNVEDQNQCDIWSKFRMGYRGVPSNLKSGHEGDFQWASGSHNAYRRFGIPGVFRLIGVQPRQFWYCLDLVPNQNGKSLSGLIHFSSETKIFEESDGRFRLEIDENSFDLSFYGVSKVKTTSGWYCPEFGLRKKSPVLEYTFAQRSSAIAGWLLSFDSSKKRILDVKRNAEQTADLLREPTQIHVSSGESDQHQFQWNPIR